MATLGIRKLAAIGRSVATHRFLLLRSSSLYVPDYLEASKSKIPLHPTLNIEIKSFTYPVLENYQKLIDVLAENLEIEIENSWAFPPKSYKIQRFKPNSAIVVSDYELNEYQRNVQIQVSAVQLPILLRALEASLPEGVTLTISEYDSTFENKRYVPDTSLLNLKEELKDMAKK